MFFKKSSGMTEQESCWIPRKVRAVAGSRASRARSSECGLKLTWKSFGTRKEERPIGVRWVDVDKGFGVCRSRLVAKGFKPKSKVNDQEGLFAATPPLELIKMLISKVARGSRNRHADVRKVMFLDVSKAPLCTIKTKRKLS